MAGLIERLARARRLPLAWRLKLYPPFLFIGVKLRLSPDCRRVEITVPVRWYGRNNNGALFGGFLAAASDPFPALLFEQLLPGVSAWNRAHALEYLRPVRAPVTARVTIGDDDLAELERGLAERGRAEREWAYSFVDHRGRPAARVSTTVYLRRRAGRS